MEQARYWMWAKKKTDPNPRNHVPIGDSWEEQAFAEDAAAGALGGSVWPPRSYSCSFCRREFRSAQALGGHMNVHRRDRARLKSSPTDHSPEVIVPQDPAPPLLNTSCSFLYNPNPDFPEIRVSSPAAAKVIISSGHDNTTTLSFLPPENDVVLWEKLPSGWTSFVGGKRDRENEISVACRKKTMMTKSIDDEDDEVVSCKRRRIEGMKASSTLFPNKLSGAVDHRTCVARSQVLKLCPGPVEELDLELRLGHAPKVK